MVQVGALAIAKPLLLWVNDGLMAIFFMLVGVEVKRAVVEGELSSVSNAALPVIAALGGMIGPALVYLACNWGDAEALRGWAIPTATDIAFALGVLALLGSRAPPSLKIFLLALAIIDDLGAIIIIAVFYTAELSLTALILAGVGVAALVALNLSSVSQRATYMLVGAGIWVCVLKSGIHATLAGVIVGVAIPLNAADGSSPAHDLEDALHPWVAFGVLPIFAFANAGVSFAGVTLAALAAPLPLGIAAGLFVGKLVGVCGASAALVRLGLARLPEGVSWRQLLGVAALCGVGFTMSLFIGSLAFEGPEYFTPLRLGVIAGSMVSGVTGYLLLRFASGRSRTSPSHGAN